MKALRLEALGQAAQLADVDSPTVRPSDVLIDVATASLSAADVAFQQTPIDESQAQPGVLPITSPERLSRSARLCRTVRLAMSW